MATCHFPQTPKSYSQQESPLNLGESGTVYFPKPTIRVNNARNYLWLTTTLIPAPATKNLRQNYLNSISISCTETVCGENQQNERVKALVCNIYPEH